MKKHLIKLLGTMLVGVLAGCGGSSDTAPQPLDPATQPEAQAAVFQRTTDRVRSLIASKDFVQAQQTLDVLKGYKLTEEQQKVVEKLKAQLPQAN